jgi:hypothetical protein
MEAIETTARFNENGELTFDKLPNLKNQNVKILILFDENEQADWFRFSGKALGSAYGENEPIYSLDMIKFN